MLPGLYNPFNAGSTANVLIPSQAAGNDSNTIVLLHMDAPQAQLGTAYFKDSAYGAPSRKNAWSVASLTPYTVASYPFNQVGYFSGVIQCPDAPDLNLVGDFTIDFWFAINNTTAVGSVLTKRPVGGFGPFLFYHSAGQLLFFASSNGSAWDIASAVVIGNYAAGNWYHCAVTRQGSTWRTFLNGNLVQTFVNAAPLMVNTQPLTVGGSVGGDYMFGWVDEVRISNICRWTASFTPPNQPYYPNIFGGGNDAATKLLLHFNGNFDDVAAGTLELSRVVQNYGAGLAGAPTNTALTGAVAGFTGGTSRVVVPHSEELNTYRGNFTIDFWYYRSANGPAADILSKRASSFYSPYMFYEGGSGNVAFLISIAGTNWDISWTVTPSLPLSTWHHFAAVRNGGDLAYYVDGALVNHQNIGLGGLYNAGGDLCIGGTTTGGNSSVQGYIDEVRFSDVARWTGPFTPPTQPYGPDRDNTVLMLHMDGANGAQVFTDSSLYGKSVTATGAFTSNGTIKFGSASAYFGAGSTANRLTIVDDVTLRVTGPFTIDFWAFITDVSRFGCLLSKSNNGSFSPFFIGVGVVTAGRLGYLISSNGTSWDVTGAGDFGVMPANAWVHIALTWDGSVWRPFINGVMGTATSSTVMPYASADSLIIGNYNNGGAFAASACGYIDEVRISKGVALWTANFTPPTAPYLSAARKKEIEDAREERNTDSTGNDTASPR